MSGICGICKPRQKIERETIPAMTAALATGGESAPQESGVLGARFAVLPRWTHQQLGAVPGVQVAAAADLQNLTEFKESLQQRGISANDMQSVAEVIGWLFKVHGPEFVNHLHGSFSIAIWDEQSSRLLLAVDRLGIDALYWTVDGDRLLFASRSSSVAAAMDEAPEVNPSALMQYLMFSVVTAPLSIYKGVER